MVRDVRGRLTDIHEAATDLCDLVKGHEGEDLRSPLIFCCEPN